MRFGVSVGYEYWSYFYLVVSGMLSFICSNIRNSNYIPDIYTEYVNI